LIDFNGLAFLGGSTDPQLLIELDVANESYDQFRRLAEFRNETIEDFFRDSGTQILEFNEETGRIRATGSDRLRVKVREANNALSKSFDNCKKTNDNAVRRLVSFAQSEFPGRKVPYPGQAPPRVETQTVPS
jgi:hypothetical protein